MRAKFNMPWLLTSTTKEVRSKWMPSSMMTEHCVNNGTSLCQTIDATHLVLTYDQFNANRTLGFTYNGEQADLMFHTTSDPDSTVYTVKLCVTNISNRKWYVLAYENPYDATTSPSIVKAMDPHVKIELYTVKEPDFHKHDELTVFFSIDYDDVMLGAEEIQHEQLVRLWQSLKLLRKESEFADMTINGIPAHRAVVAMASDMLDQSISALEYINHASIENPQDKQDCKIEANDAATEADLNDCKEQVLKKTNSKDEELETRRLEEIGASTSSVTNINSVKQKLGVQLATFAETVCDPNVYVLANLIEDLTEVVQELKVINHYKELELLDLKKPYPENYSLTMDVLNNEQHLKAFLEYVYVGNVHITIQKLGDTELSAKTQPQSTFYLYITQLMTQDNNYQLYQYQTKVLIDNLLQAANCYNLRSLVDALQSTLIDSIHNQNVQQLLQLAKKFDLDKLKLKVIDFVRNENVQLFDDPGLYQLVISRPVNYQRKTSITCNLKGISSTDSKWSYTLRIACVSVHLYINFQRNSNGYYYLALSLKTVGSPKRKPRKMTMIATLRSTMTQYNVTKKIYESFPSDKFNIPELKDFNTIHNTSDRYVTNDCATLDVALEMDDGNIVV